MATWKRCWPSTDEITKPKLKQNLIEHAEMARLSRELVGWCATRRCPSRSRTWR